MPKGVRQGVPVDSATKRRIKRDLLFHNRKQRRCIANAIELIDNPPGLAQLLLYRRDLLAWKVVYNLAFLLVTDLSHRKSHRVRVSSIAIMSPGNVHFSCRLVDHNASRSGLCCTRRRDNSILLETPPRSYSVWLPFGALKGHDPKARGNAPGPGNTEDPFCALKG
jgi:hypothetical protein